MSNSPAPEPKVSRAPIWIALGIGFVAALAWWPYALALTMPRERQCVVLGGVLSRVRRSPPRSAYPRWCAASLTIAPLGWADVISRVPASFNWLFGVAVAGILASLLEPFVLPWAYAKLLPPLPKFLTWHDRPHNHSPWMRSPRLIGREQELECLQAFLKDGGKLMVDGVFGPRGAGRSRVAVEGLCLARDMSWHAGELTAPL